MSFKGGALADTMRGRIEYVNDLHASDAIYHQTCNVNFRTGKNVSFRFSIGCGESESKRGRPISTVAQDSFKEIVRFLHDHEDEQHDLSTCLLYTSPSPRDLSTSRMPSSA